MSHKKIKLFFDIDTAAQSKKSGVGYYSLGLLQALSETDFFDITAHYFNFVGNQTIDMPKLRNVTYHSSKLVHRKLFNFLRRIGLQVPIEVLAKGTFDFSVFPNFTAKKSLRHTPYAVAVHDLAFHRFSQTVSGRNQRDLTKFVPESIKNAKLIVTISNAVAEEIQETYPISKEKKIIVTKIPSSISNKNIDTSELLEQQGIYGKYLLFIGNMEPRKNLTMLVNAYAELPKTVRDSVSLVIAGAAGWKNESTLERIQALQQEGIKIIMTGYVDEDTRLTLYKGAEALIMPSLYEGYGMPIIEALSLNKPVIVSDIPVFREVAGKNATYFDPQIKMSIINAIEQHLKHKPKTSAVNTAAKLNWNESVRELAQEIVTN